MFFTNYNKAKSETLIYFGEKYTKAYDLLSGEVLPIKNGAAKVRARFFAHNVIKAVI